jgi:hypothetical protein
MFHILGMIQHNPLGKDLNGEESRLQVEARALGTIQKQANPITQI